MCEKKKLEIFTLEPKNKEICVNLESENGWGVGEVVIKNCLGDETKPNQRHSNIKSIIYVPKYPRIYF